MDLDRVNEFRAKLCKSYTGEVDWAKVAHDRYDTVEELLFELEVETDHPQPTLGLDWEEIQKSVDGVKATSCDMHSRSSGYYEIVLGIISTLKNQEAERTTPKEKRWVVMGNTEDDDYKCLIDVYNQQVALDHRCYYWTTEKAEAECDRRNAEQKEKEEE